MPESSATISYPYLQCRPDSWESALALLVARLRADDPNRAIASNYFAVTANFLYRSAYFHCRLQFSRRTAESAVPTIALEIGFLHQRFILMGHQVRLNLRHEIHHHDYNNQQRRTTKIERHVTRNHQELREQGYCCNIHSPEQRQTGKHTIDVLGGLFSRTNTRDKRAGTLEVIRNFFGVVHQRCVEEAEEDYCCCEQNDIQRLARRQCLGHIAQPFHAFTLAKPLTERSWEQQNGRGKDRRNNTGHVHLQRQVTGLLGKYPTPLLPLGIVDGKPALAPLHEDHEADNRDCQDTNTEHYQQTHFTVTGLLQGLTNSPRETGNNPCENQQGNAVTDTTLGDLLAKPHHEDGTTHEGNNRHKVEAEAVVKGNALRGQPHRNTKALNQGQDNRTIPGVLTDLATTSFAFFLQLLKLRANRSHELHDNRGRNVRHDTECEDTHALKRTTGKHVEQAQDSTLILVKQCRQPVRVDAWNRDVGTDPVHQQRQEDKPEPRTQLCKSFSGARRQ